MPSVDLKLAALTLSLANYSALVTKIQLLSGMQTSVYPFSPKLHPVGFLDINPNKFSNSSKRVLKVIFYFTCPKKSDPLI